MRVFLYTQQRRVKLRKIALAVIGIFAVFSFLFSLNAEQLMKEQAVKYFKEAVDAQGKGDIEYAISLYAKAIYANPNYVQAYNNLGTAYAQKGDRTKAEEEYRKAVAIDPYYSVALKNLAIIYAERGDYDSFFEFWKRASGLDIYTPFIIDDNEE